MKQAALCWRPGWCRSWSGSMRLSRALLTHLSQGNGLFRADLLTAKTGDTGPGIHLGEVICHGQGRHRTLRDTGAAFRTQLRVGKRPLDCPAMDGVLDVLV